MIYQRFDREIPFKKLSQQTGESTTVLYKRMSRIYRMLRECVDRTIVGINE